MKHSANFNNTNGNAGTKWLWPSGSVVQGTETYLTFDGGNMDFGLNQQGSATRESYANTGQAGAASHSH